MKRLWLLLAAITAVVAVAVVGASAAASSPPKPVEHSVFLCYSTYQVDPGVWMLSQAETLFKAFSRALRTACERDPRAAGDVPSTKGSL